MSSEELFGKTVDGLDFARTGGRIIATVALSELSRLSDVLATQSGLLDVQLEGWRDDEGKSWMELAVSGKPLLICQRCLGAMEFDLKVESRLQLIAAGQAWPDEDLDDDSADAIAADSAMQLLPLIEDEVLLALPIAPRHESCAMSEPEWPEAAASGNGQVSRASPFSVLAALKKQ